MTTPISPLTSSYADHTASLTATIGAEAAVRRVIGGDFEAMGVVERELLRFYGLAEDGYLIDVGCGSGRLAIPLAAYLRGRYLGTDVVPALLEAARSATARPDWRFELVDVATLAIPELDGAADMVCFFSVFTHLLHEQTYLYLREARRALRPGGKIVFSFLELGHQGQWHVFETMLDNQQNALPAPLTMFLERPAIEAFAKRLDLHVDDFRAGADAFIPLSQPVTFEGGTVMKDFALLGQSVCVLSKP